VAGIKAGRIDAASYDFGPLRQQSNLLDPLRTWSETVPGARGRARGPWETCGSNRQARYVRAWTNVPSTMSAEDYGRARRAVVDEMRDLEAKARSADLDARSTAHTPVEQQLAGLAAADQIWMGEALLNWSNPDEATTKLFAAVLEARACDFEWKEARALRRILRTVRWPGIKTYSAEASENAWLIAQHVDHDLPLQSLALQRLEAAVAEGQAKPEHYAYLADRVAISSGHPQRFGTQLRCLNGKTVPAPLLDAAHVDDARRAYGLPPLAQYLKGFDRPCR